MSVLLINIDSVIPNLALKKIELKSHGLKSGRLVGMCMYLRKTHLRLSLCNSNICEKTISLHI